MKLKYYMRGLGIGIVVTALLMGIALSGKKEPMTDEEIRQRALEMGMVEENGVLADDLGSKEESEEPEEIKDNETGEEEELISGQVSDNEIEQASETEEEIEEVKEQSDEPLAAQESVVIIIYNGDGSRTVANKLQEAGVIEDAAAFDVFLCQNGYDKRIAAGEHEIPLGAALEEVAEALTRR